MLVLVTTAVAIARDGVVVMAADSLTNLYERPLPGSARKIVTVPVGDTAANALIAVCGDGALADILRSDLHLDAAPTDDHDDEQRWASAVARAITDLARDAGVVDNGHLDGTLMLGYRGRLWIITHAQAIPVLDGLAAIGSGEGVAMGAAHVLLQLGGRLTEVATEAIVIASRYDKRGGNPQPSRARPASPPRLSPPFFHER